MATKNKVNAEHPTTKRMCDKCDNKVRMQVGTIIVKGVVKKDSVQVPSMLFKRIRNNPRNNE